MTKHRIGVGIVSDVRLYREGIAQSLASREEIVVVGTAYDEASAIKLCRKLGRDVLLLDMATAGALAIIRRLADEFPKAKLVAFAIDEVEHDVIACAEAGVVGYVPRTASLEDLITVVESASRDELICSPRVASGLLRRVAAKSGAGGHAAAATLTRREREIWQLLERGLANKEIASELGIEVTTAKNHVHNLLAKLKVTSRAEAAALLHDTRGSSPSKFRGRSKAS